MPRRLSVALGVGMIVVPIFAFAIVTLGIKEGLMVLAAILGIVVWCCIAAVLMGD